MDLPSRSSRAVSAVEEEAPTVCEPALPPLPADVVSRIFDLAATPINIIMCTFAGSRFLVRECLPKLTRLVMWRSKDLDVPLVRRFLDTNQITSVDVGCLIQKSPTPAAAAPTTTTTQIYSVETAHMVPSFVCCFPNLKHIFLGGSRESSSLEYYLPYRCVSPEDHREYHHGLIWALCGAIRTGALSRSVMIEGFVYSGLYCLWSRDRLTETTDEEAADCNFCNALLEHFPMKLLLRHSVGSRGDSRLCFNERRILQKLVKRSESEFWESLMSDTFGVIENVENDREQENAERYLDFMPATLERIINLQIWGIRPDCSTTYWLRIKQKFTNKRITRSAAMLLHFLDANFHAKETHVHEDYPSPRLCRMLEEENEVEES